MYIDQARTIAGVWGIDIDYRVLDAHDVRKVDQTFDIVVFTDVLYHMKNPLQVLEDLGAMCTDAILVETEHVPYDPRNRIVVRRGAPPVLQPMPKGFMKFIENGELNGLVELVGS